MRAAAFGFYHNDPRLATFVLRYQWVIVAAIPLHCLYMEVSR